MEEKEQKFTREEWEYQQYLEADFYMSERREEQSRRGAVAKILEDSGYEIEFIFLDGTEIICGVLRSNMNKE